MNKQQEPRLRFKGFTGVWEENVLDEVVNFFSGLTYSPNDVVKNGTLVLRSSNVQDNQITTEDNVFVKESAVNCQNVEVGDVIVVVRNGSRSLIGKHAIIKEKMPNTVIGAFMTGVRSNQPDFLNALLDSYKFNQEIEKNLGATINQITTGAFRKMEFSLPPPPEQTHLGLFFRRLDSQIAESRAVLEKSRQLKKAMLAKMFPANGEKIPKIRFKGFEGEWEEKSLGKLAEQIKSYPLSRNVETLENTGFKYIHYGDIHRGIADIIYSDKVLPNIQAGNFELLKRGDLIIADVSEDYEGVGAACVIDGPLKDKVVSGLHTIAIRPNQTSPLFLYYLLKTQEFKQYGRLVGTGTKVVGITASKFLSFQTHIPTVLEQTAIGNFFRQLDETIALQLAEVEKLNQLKKGLLAAMLI